ncbi:MAG: PorP/SprF family type IX secretion system membrane protein [Bacteroidota bacterium]
MKYRTCYILLIVGLIVWANSASQAQNYPVYSSYPTNLYLYNPAEAATDNLWVLATHRQQWVGLEGAPRVSALSVSTLLDKKRVGLGGRLSNYQRGLLSNTEALATFAYGLPVSDKDALYFGISGGIVTRGFDQSKAIDPSDPAIANYLSEKWLPAANAGLVYKSGTGFNLGVSLPQMIATSTLTEANESSGFSPFKQVWFTAYFRQPPPDKPAAKKSKSKKGQSSPLELYTTYKWSSYQTSQWEAIARLHLHSNFSVHAGYRQQYGLLAGLGLSYDKFLLTYTFEPGGQPESGFSRGTHEVQAGLRIGDRKLLKRKAPVIKSAIKQQGEEIHNPRFRENLNDPEELEKFDQKQEEKASVKKRYLVVARIFNDLPAADAYKKKLIADKFNADIYYYPKDRRYYVYVFQSTKSHEATAEIKNLKTYTKLKNVRLVTIEEK